MVRTPGDAGFVWGAEHVVSTLFYGTTIIEQSNLGSQQSIDGERGIFMKAVSLVSSCAKKGKQRFHGPFGILESHMPSHAGHNKSDRSRLCEDMQAPSERALEEKKDNSKRNISSRWEATRAEVTSAVLIIEEQEQETK